MPTEQPEWLTSVTDALFDAEEGHRSTCMRVNAPIQRVIREAAARRGMSESAYVRRAAIAIAVHDLGLDWDAVMADEPPFALWGKRSGKAVQDMQGQGFGPWHVEGLS